MNSKENKLGITGKILMLFIVINIIGDIGNVIFWWASPDSRGLSLNTSIIGNAVGADGALIAGTVILLAVSAVYAYALLGLKRKQTKAPLIIIAVSIVNRILALLLYAISPAFAFWGVWTIILVALSFLVWRKMKA
jgi:Kef-type K+ transport system membrane component KefB